MKQMRSSLDPPPSRIVPSLSPSLPFSFFPWLTLSLSLFLCTSLCGWLLHSFSLPAVLLPLSPSITILSWENMHTLQIEEIAEFRGDKVTNIIQYDKLL